MIDLIVNDYRPSCFASTEAVGQHCKCLLAKGMCTLDIRKDCWRERSENRKLRGECGA